MRPPADINSLSLGYVEQLYADFLDDPAKIPAPWRGYFGELAQTRGNGHGAQAQLEPTFQPASIFNPAGRRDGSRPGEILAAVRLQEQVGQLVAAYRTLGHFAARLDPLGAARPERPELSPAHYGWTADDLRQPLLLNPLAHAPAATLGELLARLQHLLPVDRRRVHAHSRYGHARLAGPADGGNGKLQPAGPGCQGAHLLASHRRGDLRPVRAQEIHRSQELFAGRGRNPDPALDLAIEKAGGRGSAQIVMGMAHRGRLNVLANIMGKSPQRDLPRI